MELRLLRDDRIAHELSLTFLEFKDKKYIEAGGPAGTLAETARVKLTWLTRVLVLLGYNTMNTMYASVELNSRADTC